MQKKHQVTSTPTVAGGGIILWMSWWVPSGCRSRAGGREEGSKYSFCPGAPFSYNVSGAAPCLRLFGSATGTWTRTYGLGACVIAALDRNVRTVVVYT